MTQEPVFLFVLTFGLKYLHLNHSLSFLNDFPSIFGAVPLFKLVPVSIDLAKADINLKCVADYPINHKLHLDANLVALVEKICRPKNLPAARKGVSAWSQTPCTYHSHNAWALI